MSSLNLPCWSLKPFPLVLSLITCEKRPAPTSSTMSFQVVVESDEVSPYTSPPHAKQSQLLQSLLTGFVLQALPEPRCPPLISLQHLEISLVLRCPKLDTKLQVWPHQCRAQGDYHLPASAGHAQSSDTGTGHTEGLIPGFLGGAEPPIVPLPAL